MPEQGARRIATLALYYKVLPSLYFGALPQRPATDLAIYLVHRLEEGFDQGLQASLITLDISGAFDIVLKNRLILPRSNSSSLFYHIVGLQLGQKMDQALNLFT